MKKFFCLALSLCLTACASTPEIYFPDTAFTAEKASYTGNGQEPFFITQYRDSLAIMREPSLFQLSLINPKI